MLLKVQKNNHTLKKLASFFSISLAVFLSLVKLIAAFYTGSLSILSSLIDSVTDVLASLITLIAIRYSTKPVSRDFRYGYGKAEALSSFLQALFITFSGIFILYDGIYRFFNPIPLESDFLGIGIMILSLALTIALVTFQQYVIKKTKSIAIKGDHDHYIVDIATNISVIITLILIKITKIHWLDNITAIGIAAYLLSIAYKLAKNAISMLMDQELDNNIREDIEKIIKSQSFVKGVHDLRTRNLGESNLFEFHLELEPEISLVESHNFAHKVEHEIKKHYPNSQIVIHQEPKGAKEYRLDREIEKNQK